MTVKLLILVLIIVGLISYSTSDDIAKRLKHRYDDDVEKCEDDEPAYKCSGIMIRGVNNDLKLRYAWYMKQKNKERDAFSLAYLRKDQKFSSIHGCDSGFILYPHLKTPKERSTYKVYCSFPFNGATDYRKGRHGCGIFHGHSRSKHCNNLNIKSYSDWKTYFKEKIKHKKMSLHCAFDLTKKSAAKYFYIALKANSYIQEHLPKDYAFAHNELRMAAWTASKTKKLPIEAFYYIRHSSKGKRLAKKYQDAFYTLGGGEVPIVEIRLPTKSKNFKVKHYKRKPHKIK